MGLNRCHGAEIVAVRPELFLKNIFHFQRYQKQKFPSLHFIILIEIETYVINIFSECSLRFVEHFYDHQADAEAIHLK